MGKENSKTGVLVCFVSNVRGKEKGCIQIIFRWNALSVEAVNSGGFFLPRPNQSFLPLASENVFSFPMHQGDTL